MDVQAGLPAAGVVSKSQFARLTNVDRSRVSQWISEKKITGAALVGEGRDQKIDVAIASEQLKRKLDIGQRLGNGIDTKLDLRPPAPVAASSVAPSNTAPAATTPPPLVQSPTDTVEEKIKLARLASIEFGNRKAAEEEALRAGTLTDAGAVETQMGKIAAQVLMVCEGALPEFATALAAKFQIPQRDALHLLRAEFRRVRETAATAFRAKVASLPETVMHEIDDPAMADS